MKGNKRLTLNELLERYHITKKHFCDKLALSDTALERWQDLRQRRVVDVIKVHRVTNIPYIELLGTELSDNNPIPQVVKGSINVIDKLRESKELDRLTVNESKLLYTIEQQSETIKQQSNMITKQIDIIATLTNK